MVKVSITLDDLDDLVRVVNEFKNNRKEVLK